MKGGDFLYLDNEGKMPKFVHKINSLIKFIPCFSNPRLDTETSATDVGKGEKEGIT